MRIDVCTIFPAMVSAPLEHSLLGKAIAEGLVEVVTHDIRDFSADPHRSVDDASFGGGPGMVMKPEPIFAAVEALDPDGGRVIVLSPAGRRLDQALVRELAREPHLTLVCGRYEGVDERVVDGLPAEEISIGDYVLSGGELPALVVIEAVARLIPGVIGKEESHERDSFREPDVLDHPHYTRPREFRGMRVPDVLVSGDHAEIERWRADAARVKTRRNRPDLTGSDAEQKAAGR
jgi:tRNA (guanine37-N1)-methyltransferase